MGRQAESHLKLYLHIGTEKTGTTSVQKFMSLNRALLQQAGVLYPISPGNENHLALTAVAKVQGNEVWDKLGIADREAAAVFRRRFREKFAAELNTANCNTVIMSGEHCSSRLRKDEDVKRLQEFLRQFFKPVFIVVYLRRQDDFLMSTHSTDVKNGSRRPLGIPDPEEMHFRYDYWELLSKWAREFGREHIICRRYAKGMLNDDNIVSDFLQAVGIESNASFHWPGNMNESLDADSLEFLRLLNTHLRGTERLQRIVPILQQISNGPLIDLPKRELAQLMTSVRASNSKVAAEYFGGELAGGDDPLFGSREAERPRVEAGHLTTERAVEIAAALFRRFRAEGESLGREETAPKRKAG